MRALRMVREGVLVIALFSLLLLIVAKLDRSQEVEISGPFHAIDGDTLAAGDERLRLTGLDAPELDQTCEDSGGAAWDCGRDARQLLARLVRQSAATCHGRGRDRYRRLLVTCRAGAGSINAELVRRGMAVAAGQFEQEQAAARGERQGIWAGEFDAPRDWRASRGLMDSPDTFSALLDWSKRLVGWP
ncbi:thermonuclease family protein [Rhizobium deserti]|nr:thermonuclease family protein [Rhizobium deserti]